MLYVQTCLIIVLYDISILALTLGGYRRDIVCYWQGLFCFGGEVSKLGAYLKLYKGISFKTGMF